MSLFRFLKNTEPRKFTYEPRFYDEEKDDLKSRLAKIEDSQGEDIDAMKLRIKDGMKRTSNMNKEWKSKLTRQKNRRFTIVLMLLIVATLILVLLYMPMLDKYLNSF